MKTGKHLFMQIRRSKDYYYDTQAWKLKQRRRLFLAVGLFWFCVYQGLSAGGVL